jgi:hypothetical protein
MAKATAQTTHEAKTADDHLGQLYVAHQVHTLAQILFQQLAIGPPSLNSSPAWMWAPVRPFNHWYP